jgi:hypothetical protein
MPMTTKNCGKDRMSGSTIHAVYDGDRFVTSIREVFRDVFYVSGSGTRHRSLKAALAAVEATQQ